MNPFMCCISWWPRVSWTHWTRNHSLLWCQYKSTWANSVLATWSVCWYFSCSSVIWPLSPGASMSMMYLHNQVVHLAQMALPLHCQLCCFHCCHHPHRASAPIHETVQRWSIGHFSCSVMSDEPSWMGFASANWLTLSFSSFHVLS